MEIRSPMTMKEVKRLNGQIITLSRFKSKSIKRYVPFYKMLMKDKAFKWSNDYENAFIQLKENMSSPLILTRLKDRETLFLYIDTLHKVVGIVLVMEKDDE